MDATAFRIEVPEGVLEDLRRRLARARFSDATPAWLRDLARHWALEFDWRARERALNEHPQFIADVGGTKIHFVHARGKGPDPFPLVLTHGWPGTFAEFQDLIPLLTGDPRDPFDVVVPSMPGYGFSDRPRIPGMTNLRIADLWAALMEGLGYARYGAQGGDWGAGVSTWLARRHPAKVAGIHLNYVPGSYRPYTGPGSAPLTEAEARFLAGRDRWLEEDGAYGHMQATRPDTAAVGLNDSPAGLLAWIGEKFRDWAGVPIPDDDVLTHVTLYWVTETIGSSMRLYRESQATPLVFERGERVAVPTGVARFEREAPMPPREWVERAYDVRRWTEIPGGGHFAAMEMPEALAREIREFFRPLRSPSARA